MNTRNDVIGLGSDPHRLWRSVSGSSRRAIWPQKDGRMLSCGQCTGCKQNGCQACDPTQRSFAMHSHLDIFMLLSEHNLEDAPNSYVRRRANYPQIIPNLPPPTDI